ncbi:MAG: hypothetical protein JW940_12135 [Polyangiaceae bacterium]|nr:hypothetical protein [Polyangiaceae bacterium]
MSREIPERLARTGAVFALLVGCGSHDQLDLHAQQTAPGSAGEMSAAGAEATGGQPAQSGGTTGGAGHVGGAGPRDPTAAGAAGAPSQGGTGGSVAGDAGAGLSGSVGAAGGGSTGGAPTGGTETGGVSTGGVATGATPTGGAETRGATGGGSTGGAPTGGTETGGVSTGEVATGATPTGGTETGGATGGASTGGTATGGASTGGTATGGASTGGTATGGTPTGGTETGGASAGGTATGGASMGGTATGGGSTGGEGNGGAAGTGGDGGGPACTAETCGAHGTCTTSGGAGPCQCDPGYDGDYCTQCAEGYELNAITRLCELPCPNVRQIRCGGQCVDGTAAQSCGSCDNDCGDALCMPSHGSWECICPYTLCGGVCSNTLIDENNCTYCGKVCPEDQRCFQGACRTPAVEPPASSCVGEGELWCGADTCLESPSDGYDEDENNCGGCGNECDPEQICVAGQCQPASDRCWWPCDSSRGELCCGRGACVDYLSDPHNCGSCGMNCDDGEACVGGHCQCASPTARCGEDGHCYDLRFDNDNCGACGHQCEIIAGERCVYGECVQGEAGCGLSCGSDELCCPGDAPEAALECVEISSMLSSSERCGGCQPCPSGQICSDGVCGCSWPNASCPDPDDPDTRICVSLETPEDCGDCGFECTGARECVAPAASDPEDRCACPDALTWCSDSETCVDLAHDEQDCGGCGNVCNAGEKCIGHRCVEQNGDCGDGCSEDQACCLDVEDASSVCTDVLDDASHCGGCAITCEVTYTCSGGLCQAAGDLCSAPAVLPPAGIDLDTDLSAFADDGEYPTACGATEEDTEAGVEAFYVLEAPEEGATYDVAFFSDDGVTVSMGTAASSSDVCAASYATCLTWDPIAPTLSGPVAFMISGPASATFYLSVWPW